MANALDYIPARPRPQVVPAAMTAQRLDMADVPAAVALAELAQALRELAAEKIVHLRDISCTLTCDARGVCSLNFRAYA